jgi:hypothetical protein
MACFSGDPALDAGFSCPQETHLKMHQRPRYLLCSCWRILGVMILVTLWMGPSRLHKRMVETASLNQVYDSDETQPYQLVDTSGRRGLCPRGLMYVVSSYGEQVNQFYGCL